MCCHLISGIMPGMFVLDIQGGKITSLLWSISHIILLLNRLN